MREKEKFLFWTAAVLVVHLSHGNPSKEENIVPDAMLGLPEERNKYTPDGVLPAEFASIPPGESANTALDEKKNPEKHSKTENQEFTLKKHDDNKSEPTRDSLETYLFQLQGSPAQDNNPSPQNNNLDLFSPTYCPPNGNNSQYDPVSNPLEKKDNSSKTVSGQLPGSPNKFLLDDVPGEPSYRSSLNLSREPSLQLNLGHKDHIIDPNNIIPGYDNNSNKNISNYDVPSPNTHSSTAIKNMTGNNTLHGNHILDYENSPQNKGGSPAKQPGYDQTIKKNQTNLESGSSNSGYPEDLFDQFDSPGSKRNEYILSGSRGSKDHRPSEMSPDRNGSNYNSIPYNPDGVMKSNSTNEKVPLNEANPSSYKTSETLGIQPPLSYGVEQIPSNKNISKPITKPLNKSLQSESPYAPEYVPKSNGSFSTDPYGNNVPSSNRLPSENSKYENNLYNSQNSPAPGKLPKGQNGTGSPYELNSNYKSSETLENQPLPSHEAQKLPSNNNITNKSLPSDNLYAPTSVPKSNGLFATDSYGNRVPSSNGVPSENSKYENNLYNNSIRNNPAIGKLPKGQNGSVPPYELNSNYKPSETLENQPLPSYEGQKLPSNNNFTNLTNKSLPSDNLYAPASVPKSNGLFATDSNGNRVPSSNGVPSENSKYENNLYNNSIQNKPAPGKLPKSQNGSGSPYELNSNYKSSETLENQPLPSYEAQNLPTNKNFTKPVNKSLQSDDLYTPQNQPKSNGSFMTDPNENYVPSSKKSPTENLQYGNSPYDNPAQNRPALGKLPKGQNGTGSPYEVNSNYKPSETLGNQTVPSHEAQKLPSNNNFPNKSLLSDKLYAPASVPKSNAAFAIDSYGNEILPSNGVPSENSKYENNLYNNSIQNSPAPGKLPKGQNGSVSPYELNSNYKPSETLENQPLPSYEGQKLPSSNNNFTNLTNKSLPSDNLYAPASVPKSNAAFAIDSYGNEILPSNGVPSEKSKYENNLYNSPSPGKLPKGQNGTGSPYELNSNYKPSETLENQPLPSYDGQKFPSNNSLMNKSLPSDNLYAPASVPKSNGGFATDSYGNKVPSSNGVPSENSKYENNLYNNSIQNSSAPVKLPKGQNGSVSPYELNSNYKPSGQENQRPVVNGGDTLPLNKNIPSDNYYVTDSIPITNESYGLNPYGNKHPIKGSPESSQYGSKVYDNQTLNGTGGVSNGKSYGTNNYSINPQNKNSTSDRSYSPGVLPKSVDSPSQTPSGRETPTLHEYGPTNTSNPSNKNMISGNNYGFPGGSKLNESLSNGGRAPKDLNGTGSSSDVNPDLYYLQDKLGKHNDNDGMLLVDNNYSKPMNKNLSSENPILSKTVPNSSGPFLPETNGTKQEPALGPQSSGPSNLTPSNKDNILKNSPASKNLPTDLNMKNKYGDEAVYDLGSASLPKKNDSELAREYNGSPDTSKTAKSNNLTGPGQSQLKNTTSQKGTDSNLYPAGYGKDQHSQNSSKSWPVTPGLTLLNDIVTSEETSMPYENEIPPGPKVVPVGQTLKPDEMKKLCALPSLPKGENICYQRNKKNVQSNSLETWIQICEAIATSLGYCQGLCLYIESPIDSEVYYSVCGVSKSNTSDTSDTSSWVYLTTQDIPIRLPAGQECPKNQYKVLHEVQSAPRTFN